MAVGAFVPAASAQNAGNENANPKTAGTETSSPSNPALSRLLNKANAINYEEIQMAKMVNDKAGDNQALMTLAKTMQGDHQANEDAVTALSNAKSIKLSGTPGSIDQKMQRMQNLSGAQFNRAFLTDAVQDHTKALHFFESERSKFRGEPDVNLYVAETIPVIRAHLEMAQNMQKELGHASTENPANNKSASR